MLSTCHSAKMIDTGKTYANDSVIYKPSVVRSYNSHMGGVDRVDQQLHSLRTLHQRRSKGGAGRAVAPGATLGGRQKGEKIV